MSLPGKQLLGNRPRHLTNWLEKFRALIPGPSLCKTMARGTIPAQVIDYSDFTSLISKNLFSRRTYPAEVQHLQQQSFQFHL